MTNQQLTESDIVMAKNHSHISTEEIKSDLYETERELNLYQEKLQIAEKERNRLDAMKAQHNIDQRVDLIKTLNIILIYRNEQ